MPPTENNKVDDTSADASKDKAAKTKKLTPLGGFPSIEEFTNNGLKEIMDATRCVNGYPQASSRDLYCAYPIFGKIIDQQSHRILGLISKVLKRHNVKGNIQRRQQDEQFEMLLECNDAILERLNCNLDEMAGIKKNPQTIVIESRLNAGVGSTGSGAGSWNLNKEKNSLSARLITAKNIARPQMKFKVPVDNRATVPFVPKIKTKPNSLKPLAVLPEYDEAGNIVSYLHPYEFELMKFEVPEAQLARTTPKTPADMSTTELVYVDTVPKLQKALEELRQHKIIAIDLEHHSYRTFQGFTCLMQLSTRSKDYLFDTLELREELHILNEVFTDPKVLKIFHGADSDVEWLQRDLSLYVVNMFDTHQAAKALSFARLSLAFLLKHFCGIEADKTFQLADWRMRPLPDELVAYARQDTHFLIYIYECLTNELLDAAHQQTNLLRSIYQRSTELCKKRYCKPVLTSESHLDFFHKSKRIFDNRQLYALREVYKWRDSVARLEDESYGYVLPNHMILQIAESLPREMQGILACCNPIPPLVRQHLHTLHQIVLVAREQPLVKPILETDNIHRIANTNVRDYNSKLYCQHDLSHAEEFRDDLPTLLKITDNAQIETNESAADSTETNAKLCEPKLTIFNMPTQTEEAAAARKAIIEKIQFISPYQRYLAVLPLVEKEKQEEAAKIEAANKERLLCPAAEVIPLKTQAPDQTDAEEDIYSVPVKEFLKRKYEESVAKKKTANANDTPSDAPAVKRLKTETPTDDKLKFVELPPTKKQLKQQQAKLQQEQQQQQQANKSKTPAKGRKRKATTEGDGNDTTTVVTIPDDEDDTNASAPVDNNNDADNDDSDAPPIEMPTSSQALTPSLSTTPAERAALKKKNKRNKFKFNRTQQSSDKPIVPANFDYKNVDFKKFQGGAQRAKGTEIKPQFRAKSNSNKATNKKFNKLFTFSNVKSKK